MDQNEMNGNYGIPRDVRANVKLSIFILKDLVTMVITTMLTFFAAMRIFPTTQWVKMIAFIVLTIGIVFYLILPYRGGKKNWQALLLLARRRKTRWISFDWKY